MTKLEIILEACEDKIGEDIKTIDISHTSIADNLVIVTGTNFNHTRAIVDEIEDKLEKNGFSVKSVEGFRDGTWILLDVEDVIVHVFTKDKRDYYNLEKLWEQ